MRSLVLTLTAASLLIAPAAGAADRRTEQALTQERAYTNQIRVVSTPRPTPDDGTPVALIAGSLAGAVLVLGGAGVAVRRRHARPPLAARAA
jgi:predicted amidohydrolase